MKNMIRRTFLKQSAIVAAGLALPARMFCANSKNSLSSERLTLSTPITHCDWMLKDNRADVVWGAEGVRHMLTVCKAAGISQVYWRVLDAGRAMYKSRLVL